MPRLYDVVAIGNAIVDVIAPASERFLQAEGLAKGAMTLIDESRAHALYARMAPGVEASGGSAANTAAGVASLGGRAAFLGKIADDQLGEVFAHDMRAIGVEFRGGALVGGPSTGRCLANVTPDGERTMCTYLGAAVELGHDDIDSAVVEGGAVLYLEGYLFDPPEARRAFARAAGLARGAGRSIALSLSDAFVVDRHRETLLGFIRGQVDVVFANEAELLSLFRTSDFSVAARSAADLARIVAVTRGENGSVIIADGEQLAVGALAVDRVADTTGAGDQYAAGFLHALANGKSLDVCGRLASLAAAEVISHYGPRPQVCLRELATAQGL
ncbi:MAG TPA: adenosine kinase [Caulobacteraceae bacterium]